MTPGRVILKESDLKSVGGSDFTTDIRTNGSGPALVTLDTNVKFPSVRDLYARGFNGHIRLTVRFNGTVQPTASKLAVVCAQATSTTYQHP